MNNKLMLQRFDDETMIITGKLEEIVINGFAQKEFVVGYIKKVWHYRLTFFIEDDLYTTENLHDGTILNLEQLEGKLRLACAEFEYFIRSNRK